LGGIGFFVAIGAISGEASVQVCLTVPAAHFAISKKWQVHFICGLLNGCCHCIDNATKSKLNKHTMHIRCLYKLHTGGYWLPQDLNLFQNPVKTNLQETHKQSNVLIGGSCTTKSLLSAVPELLHGSISNTHKALSYLAEGAIPKHKVEAKARLVASTSPELKPTLPQV
jgi:hypothetical protein